MGKWKGADFDKTCGDCIHADICEHNPSLEFSRENIAWCDSFKDKTDVVEVRHSQWFFTEYEYFTCANCGRDVNSGSESTCEAKEMLKKGLYDNYCPNCGAKMDGKRKDGVDNE